MRAVIVSWSNNSFQIQVNKKERKLIIRDDITLQVVRLSLARFFQKPRPLKLCYYGEVVRRKRQRNKWKHWAVVEYK